MINKELQKRKALEWCRKYNIRINFACYYLNRTISD